MFYKTFAPPPSLVPYVRYFWALEGVASQAAPYIHRTMANGCPEFIFHYKGLFDEVKTDECLEKSMMAGIQGQSQYFRRFAIYEDFGIFGAFLYPYAVAKFFGIDAAVLNNTMINWYELLHNEGNDLVEKMMLAESNLQRVNILTFFLEEKMMRSKSEEPAIFSCINEIIAHKGLTKVEALSKDYFLSARQFDRRFRQFAGFGPKLFSRIARFEAALNEYGNKNISLTQIAYKCGYYDQSHFIHDFREFSGHHPKHYFSGNAEGTEWKQ